jgi:hypothetical protein
VVCGGVFGGAGLLGRGREGRGGEGRGWGGDCDSRQPARCVWGGRVAGTRKGGEGMGGGLRLTSAGPVWGCGFSFPSCDLAGGGA